MNDTPRTDVHAFDWTAIARREAPANSAYVVDADFARQLERENARLREALQNVMKFFGNAEWEDTNGNDFTSQLSKARQALKGE